MNGEAMHKSNSASGSGHDRVRKMGGHGVEGVKREAISHAA
jgi:hypothetical protein